MLSPSEVIESVVGIGRTKVNACSNPARVIILAVLAGAYIALGGVLSIIVGYGFPGLTAGNPALQRLLSGLMFPIGLVLVVVLGAELFTGNNALLIPGLMKRHFTMGDVLRNWGLVYVGNFIGALLFCVVLVYAAGLTSADPWHSAIVKMAHTKVSLGWGVVFVRGIGANWCVCLAVWLALSGRTLPAKVIGCWLPVMAFVALGYEHCVANMFFIPLGMLEGANVSIGQMIIDNLIPATLGNIVGGALLVGCIHARLHLPPKQ